MAISILLCGLIGALIAGLKVLLFEQTKSGRYAVHQECVLWNDSCVRGCQDAAQENPQNPPSCDGCCLRHDDVVESLGMRIATLAKMYGVFGGSIGLGVGLIIADDKKRKLELGT